MDNIDILEDLVGNEYLDEISSADQYFIECQKDTIMADNNTVVKIYPSREY